VQLAGELVTRDELCRRLWPDGTHVDFEGNLNAIVRDVREALGDSARHSQFIETEPKCGYRFVAPASLSARAPAAGDIAVAALPLKPRRRTLLVKFALLAALVLFAIFVVYQLRLIEKASLPARITRLTNFLGSAEHPTFSPDGSRIAFEWNGDARGTFDIYIKTMGSDNLWRLTADPVDDESPAWSPDGRDIAFLRANSPGEAALMLMPVLGGPEQQITVVPTGSTFAWSADGRWIAYSSSLPDYVRATTDAERGIRAISLETGKTVQITSPSRDALGDISPAFSPDGRQLAFVRIFSVGAGDLYVLRIGRDLRPLSKPRRLTFDLRYIDSPAWLPGSREIVFTSERGSFASLWKVPVSEPSQVRLLGGEDAYDPAVDPKGGEIVYSQLSLVDSLNRLDLCGLGCTPAAPKRIFFSEKKARNPSYSPDGRRIAFESFRSGNCEIWICNRDGSNARQLTHFNGPLTGSPRWAPDGQSLAFDSRVAGRGKIFTMSAKGGTPRQLTFGSAEDVVPFWSPDGHWIYFASNRRGNFQIWKVPAGGGSPRQVTRNGGFYPEESPDGKTLYYVKSVMNPPIWRVPTSGGEESLILSPISDWQNYSVAHDGIFFVP
ncbi:MAG: LpqB family beta-propeller domain-containing protein, partial [Terriglobia bacterium]